MGIVLVEQKLGLKLPEIFLEQPFAAANIVVNTDKELGDLPRIWPALGQGGEERGNMIKPTVSYLKRLKPSYIRLDHIFDDDYYGVVQGRKAGGSLQLNWTKLDDVVVDINSTGAKPFLSLSYMPGTIAASKIDVPNWRDWQDLIRQTVEHYSAKYDNVYYEVWNEPSLPMFGSWKMFGSKDYRLLYQYAVAGASQAVAVHPYKIGGPAIPEMDDKWISLLFDFAIDKNLRLDFISWHRYNFDPNRFNQDIEEINVLTSEPKYQQFTNIEKIITEWGPNSEKDSVYSSGVAASHMVAVVRQLLNKANLLFAFEVKDGPGQENKGWGILTHESVGVKPKPRFFLFEWLANFEGRRLEVLGEGSQITGFAFKNERTTTLLLTNYLPSGSQEESFLASFSGLAEGRYRLLKQLLFGKPEEQEIEVKNGGIVFNLTMKPYSVLRLQLTQF